MAKFNFVKNFVVTGIIFMLPVSVSAAQLTIVETLSEFSTKTPTETIQIKLIKNTDFYDIKLPKDTIINVDITEVKQPKRLKRDATFSFVPDSYINKDGETVKIETPQKAKFIKKTDIKVTAKDAAIGVTKSAANKIVPGLGLGVGVIEGALEAEDGDRLKSAAEGLYNATPISYFSKGQEIILNSGDYILIKLSKIKNSSK